MINEPKDCRKKYVIGVSVGYFIVYSMLSIFAPELRLDCAKVFIVVGIFGYWLLGNVYERKMIDYLN